MSTLLYVLFALFALLVVGVIVYTLRGLKQAKDQGVQRTSTGPDVPARGSPGNPR